MSQHFSTSTDKPSLRRQLRARRQALQPQQHERLSAAVCRQARIDRILHRQQHIAVYLYNDNEVNLGSLVDYLWSSGRSVYLPCLDGQQLNFKPFRPDSEMEENQFGIPEPVLDRRQAIPVRMLDLVFTPLVGFDDSGNRLGMGGGYYDRTFSWLRRARQFRKPRLVGAAFELQRAPALPSESLDVPLYGVVTETGLSRF